MRSTLFLLLTIVFISCGQQPQQPGSSGDLDRSDAFDPEHDYFPDKSFFRYADQVQLEYHGHYKLLTFRPNGSQDILRFVLVQRGTPAPSEYSDAVRIDVPVRNFMITNWRYTGLIGELGLQDQLLGVGNLRAITAPAVLERVSNGLIPEINGDGGLNLEQIIGMKPDLVMTYYSSTPQGNVHPKLEEAGIRTLPLADDTEASPLGRAEWIKVFAVLFNRDGDIERMFNEVVQNYQKLASVASTARSRPRVAVNYPVRDRWTIYGGKSAFAKLIADAGGEYVWNDNLELSVTTAPFETAYARSRNADYWLIGPTGAQANIDQILLRDSRFRSMDSIRTGRIYLCGRLDEEGRNPYWDQALPRPDLELRDFVQILHPELLSGEPLMFYRPIRQSE
jgi:iron complex transport system substrate-binding protein